MSSACCPAITRVPLQLLQVVSASKLHDRARSPIGMPRPEPERQLSPKQPSLSIAKICREESDGAAWMDYSMSALFGKSANLRACRASALELGRAVQPTLGSDHCC